MGLVAGINAVTAAVGIAGSALKLSEGLEQDRLDELDAKEQEALARQRAADVTRRGNLAAGRARMQAGQLAAEQEFAYANSGVDATVGTPAGVIASQRMLSEQDARTMENDAVREAWGLRRAADKLSEQQKIIRGRKGMRIAGTALGITGTVGSAVGETLKADR